MATPTDEMLLRLKQKAEEVTAIISEISNRFETIHGEMDELMQECERQARELRELRARLDRKRIRPAQLCPSCRASLRGAPPPTSPWRASLVPSTAPKDRPRYMPLPVGEIGDPLELAMAVALRENEFDPIEDILDAPPPRRKRLHPAMVRSLAPHQAIEKSICQNSNE
jgi:hypothetical protein